jgi:pSer/pThr/pTyr-binding forkhead associated (FHA) protein
MTRSQATFYLSDGTTNFELSRTATRIGRADDCDICTRDVDISRHHADLILTNGRLTVYDLESTNGTFVNGRRVRIHELHAGDVLNISGRVFVVDTRARTLWSQFAACVEALRQMGRTRAAYLPVGALSGSV